MNLTPDDVCLILLALATLILAAYWQRRAWSEGRDRDGTEP